MVRRAIVFFVVSSIAMNIYFLISWIYCFKRYTTQQERIIAHDALTLNVSQLIPFILTFISLGFIVGLLASKGGELIYKLFALCIQFAFLGLYIFGLM